MAVAGTTIFVTSMSLAGGCSINTGGSAARRIVELLLVFKDIADGIGSRRIGHHKQVVRTEQIDGCSHLARVAS